MTIEPSIQNIMTWTKDAENIQHLWSRWLVGLLRYLSAECFVVSPGYRCAPLLYALHQSGSQVYSQTDERAAAYFALGLAKASLKPPVLVCTSGTAVANYYPAVLEAYTDHIPLIILSADRPFDLHDCGANQTIRQTKIFGEFCVASLNLPEPSETISPQVIWQRLQSTVTAAIQMRRPVHINLPFREPLEPVADAVSERYLEQLAVSHTAIGKPSALPVTACDTTPFRRAWADHSLHTGGWIVVVGSLPPEASRDARQTSALLSWLTSCTAPIYCDVASSLKQRLSRHPGLIIDPDNPAILAQLKNRLAQGAGIIHIGDRITSGPWQRQLTQSTGPYLRLSPSGMPYNPGSNISLSFTGHLGHALADAPAPKGPAFDQLAPERPCELRMAAAEAILASLTGGDVLYLGNSSVIRVFNRIVSQVLTPEDSIEVAANRGVSGIEGLISSAKGFHHGSGRRVVVVLGDISFLYDLGALLDSYLTAGIKIILFNDQQGSIFNNLPGRHYEGFINDLMTTPHNICFDELLKGFPLETQQVTGPDQLSGSLPGFLAADHPGLLEILISS